MQAFVYPTNTQSDVVTPEKVNQETFRSLLLELQSHKQQTDTQLRRLVLAFATSLFFLAAAVAALWIMVMS